MKLKMIRATPNILIDVQTLEILHQNKITLRERDFRNKEARNVGEIILNGVLISFHINCYSTVSLYK
jgi:hypothetical protein